MDTGLASLNEFLSLKVERLDTYDFLDLSYYAARGLPGTEKSDLELWYSKRDAWAYRVQFETARHLYRYDPKTDPPTHAFYGNSLGRFLCYFMLQVLQEDCGVRYHPSRKMNPGSCKPRDVFAHGIMDDDGEGGTCASMPVVYVSIGRRLGYPVHLVETHGHLFCRWHAAKETTIRWRNPDVLLRVPPERFNFDGSGEGIGFYSDDHYRQWPEPWTDFEIEHGYYLRSLTARQALASFLFERGECFWDFKMIGPALKSFHAARQLVPDDERYKYHHDARFKQYELQRILLEEDRRMRQIRLGSGTVHAPGCRCTQCWQAQTVLNQMPRLPPHGPYCQCCECKTPLAATSLQGVPGHPLGCGCAGCCNVRQFHSTVSPRLPRYRP